MEWKEWIEAEWGVTELGRQGRREAERRAGDLGRTRNTLRSLGTRRTGTWNALNISASFGTISYSQRGSS
jgi:hypothetical protein